MHGNTVQSLLEFESVLVGDAYAVCPTCNRTYFAKNKPRHVCPPVHLIHTKDGTVESRGHKPCEAVKAWVDGMDAAKQAELLALPKGLTVRVRRKGAGKNSAEEVRIRAALILNIE